MINNNLYKAFEIAQKIDKNSVYNELYLKCIKDVDFELAEQCLLQLNDEGKLFMHKVVNGDIQHLKQ